MAANLKFLTALVALIWIGLVTNDNWRFSGNG